MTSILTNTSAMNALQTLKNTNMNLSKTQQEISTGKSIGSARDNAAVWAISKVMESDVKGFEQISNSLALGQSTIAVARNAAESITDLLTDIKGLVVSAQEENVDRAKINTDIDKLVDQITSVVQSAQFNGLNLIDGSETADVNILSSLNRAADGSVSSSSIAIQRQNLSVTGTATAQVFGGTANTDTSIINNGGTVSGTEVAMTGGASQTISIASVAAGNSYRIALNDTDTAATPPQQNTLGAREFEYVANADDTAETVAANLFNQISTFIDVTNETNYSVEMDGSNIVITTAVGAPLDVTATAATGGTAATNAGGLSALSIMDVSTSAGAASALTAIEGLIQTGINASAAFGSAEKRIDIQADFVSKLTDSFKSGIGTLVDADMEEASARLQALQVQQQLGVQALSIANQSPQALLSLFR